MSSSQPDLFGAPPPPALPEGMRYAESVVPPELQRGLLAKLPELPFRAFDFHGFLGKRRVVSFGWKYDFDQEKLHRIDDMPELLLPARQVAAEFAGIEPAQLQQVLVTEYGPGAGIGWHRDKAVFGEVVGLSLLAPCTFRLRQRTGQKWERVSIEAAPGSAYLLAGAARSEWEHSIPPVERLRYSLTFRNIRIG
ncbi:MAG TPA: alpha-ketoglutarate-dependent dioxygenase AlkB [Devosiaceae bacterium]|jgi:alkylated DNA repair dioxygenase AlkB|nr:alpha-ketoglutarate-dependent dioxygenase AlkB [Devosiaceae bacterium]